MNKTFKKITASVMAVATLSACAIGMAANAASTTYWNNSTSGNKTTRSKYTTTSIVGNPQSASLSMISAVMSHTVSASKVNTWTITATNLTDASKYMYARTYATNRDTSLIEWDTYKGASGSRSSGKTISSTSSATESSLPSRYTLWYETDISAGGESQSPVVQGIELEERLSK